MSIVIMQAAAVVRRPEERPLALILEHAEGMDPGLLHDLITLLSEACPLTCPLPLQLNPAM